MKRFITYGSIGQFREVISKINHHSSYIGQNEDGTAKYDSNIRKPIVTAIATEKIHGTNGSVSFSNPDGFWIQSRKNIITPEKDNAACAFFATSKKDVWMDIIMQLQKEYNIDLDTHIITLYFEWAGGNIQKKSAVTGFDKMAFIFQHFKVSPIDPQLNNNGEEINSFWLETKTDNWLDSKENNIFNIMNFPTYQIEIDFETPTLYQNQMIELVEKVIEPSSPVGNVLFDIFEKDKLDNVGEGLVLTFNFKDVVYRFKVKGEAHTVTKVKTLKVVDEEAEKVKIEFANYATPAHRLEQAWQTVFGLENELRTPDVKATGDFLRAVHKDIMKEEMDIMAEKGLEPKQVNGMISKIAKRWFSEQLDKHMGLL